MKVICGKEELVRGLQNISPAVSSKSALPVLSNFLFATESDKIKLSSTDLEIAAQCYIKGEIVEEGAVTIPAKRFLDIAKELPGDKAIEIKADDANKINIVSGKSKFNLTGISKTEYPAIPEFPKKNNFSIKKDILLPMLRKTVFSASKDPQRYILNGVYFILSEENKFEIVSTDGRRLSYIYTNDFQTDSKIKGKIIIPSRTINDIIRLLSSDDKTESVKIGISDNHIAVEINDITLVSTLIEGVFPNYEQVIPKKSELKVKLNTKNALSAVRQMALLTVDKLNADRAASIKFTFSENKLNISAKTAGVGEGETDLEIEFSGEPVEINFNPDFVKEVLQNIDEDTAILEFTSSLNPIILSPEKDKNYLCVVMPMRV
jgi:DNA polymerase-3 subunit beta